MKDNIYSNDPFCYEEEIHLPICCFLAEQSFVIQIAKIFLKLILNQNLNYF